MGKARPEVADEEVESVLFERTGLSPARVDGSGCEGMKGTKLVGGGPMGIAELVVCDLFVC